MPYGILKVDTITFTNGGVDQSITVSGIVASTSGNLTVTGTVSGNVIRGGTTVSGATVTGSVGQFGNLTAVSGVFTTQISGSTVTGNVGQFTSVTGGTAGFTTVTGTTVTGTTANFVTVSGTTVTGATANFTSGNFTSISGGTHTITSGVFAAGSATNPSISFASDPNTGIYSPGADQVAISTNGSQRLLVDSSGNIGIGGSVGFGRITHGIHVTGSGTGEGIRLQTSNGSTGILEIAAESGGAVLDTRGSGYIRFNSSTTEWARFDSNGRLGLGTSSPDRPVHLKSSGNRNYFKAETTGNAGSDEAGFQVTTPSANWLLVSKGNANSLELYDAVTANSRLFVDSSGRVGIGTTSPVSALNVSVADGGNLTISNTNDGHTGALAFGDTSSNTSGRVSYDHFNNSMRFDTAGTERVRLDSSGRLLVGTTSTAGNTDAQTALVQIQGNSSGSFQGGRANISRAEFSANVAAGEQLGGIYFSDAQSGTYGVIECVADAAAGANDYPGRLVFSTTADGASSPTERMRIDCLGRHTYASAGSSPFSSVGYGFHFKASSYYCIAFEYEATDAAGEVVNIFHRATTGNNQFLILKTDGGVGSTRGSIDYNRAAGQVRYNVTSDRRLKSDIQDAGSALSILNQIKVRSYTWTETGYGVEYGFIAQELNEAAPDAVKVGDDGDEVVDTWAVDNAKLVPVLTKALQEAIAEITSLKDRLTAAGL